MIYFNGELVNVTRFPDNTLSFRLAADPSVPVNRILWRYDDDSECMVIWDIVHHVRSHVTDAQIILDLPYIPNARMDRVKERDEVFTLKWFAEFINSLNFRRVYVLDAHSNVSAALINNACLFDSSCNVRNVLGIIDNKDVLLCYPDEGSVKRNADLFEMDYVFGIKHRDWRSGKIECLEITTPEKVVGKDILIIDDICSKGGTFVHTAKALKAAGANKIYLYISHCENTVFSGELITLDLIEHIFTTNSIYRGDHEKITVV